MRRFMFRLAGLAVIVTAAAGATPGTVLRDRV